MKQLGFKLKPFAKVFVLLTAIALVTYGLLGLTRPYFMRRWLRKPAKVLPDWLSNATDEVFITVKTSRALHATRVQLIIDTWYNDVKPGNIAIITDHEDEVYVNKTAGSLLSTNCGNQHYIYDLCCKTGVEYDAFIKTSKPRWWCHFDDDNYVNVKRLKEVLKDYDGNSSVYVGRLSRGVNSVMWKRREVFFYFGTGGAGFCITRHLANLMHPYAAKGEFEQTCDVVQAEDDCTMGFVINGILGIPLNESYFLHSHQEFLDKIPEATFKEQVSLSYRGTTNLIKINPERAAYNELRDPTRMRSLHCIVQPEAKICPRTDVMKVIKQKGSKGET